MVYDGLASDPSHPVEGGSANDYDYVGGDPVNSLDLDGLCKKKKGIGIIRNAVCHAGNVVTKNRVAKHVGNRVNHYYQHTDISAGICVLACVGIGFQGGTVYIQRGGGLAVGASVNAGIASKEYKDRACSNVNLSVGPVYGTAAGSSGGWRDVEAGGALSIGGGLSTMQTWDGRYCR